MFSIEIGMILLLLLLTIFFGVLCYVFLCLWVYHDAKSRCVSAPFWTVITVLFSVIGFLVYFMIGRKRYRTKCANCKNPVNPSFTCCPNCGMNLSSQNIIGYNQYVKAQSKPHPVKQIKIVFFVALSLCFVSMAACSVLLIKTANTYSYESSHYID